MSGAISFALNKQKPESHFSYRDNIRTNRTCNLPSSQGSARSAASASPGTTAVPTKASFGWTPWAILSELWRGRTYHSGKASKDW